VTCNSECKKPRGRQAHCGVCHKTFAGVTVFDDHRKLGKCSDIGLTDKNGIWGRWGTRLREEHWREA
jgi:hypothetical protein